MRSFEAINIKYFTTGHILHCIRSLEIILGPPHLGPRSAAASHTLRRLGRRGGRLVRRAHASRGHQAERADAADAGIRERERIWIIDSDIDISARSTPARRRT